jgi:stage V sporulation protein G
MKITDVKVFPVDEDKLKAYATITFDNCFIVRDLKVISGNKGYFIAMPSKKRKDGTFRDVAHPLNSETRKMIEDAVLQVYEKENVPLPSEQPQPDAEADNAGTEAARSEDEGRDTGEEEVSESVVESAEEQSTVEDAAADGETGQTEEKEKGAEENPVIEPSDDPEKAFGYEE